MLQNKPQLRLLASATLSSIVSFGFCVAMAFLLMREQHSSAEILGENIGSRRAAADLEESLFDLLVLLRDRNEGVAALNDRIVEHIREVCQFADQPHEQELANDASQSFSEYLSVLRSLPDSTGTSHEARRREAVAILETRTLPLTQQLREFNTRRLDDFERDHRLAVRRLAWSLAGIGGTAALTGIFLGFGFARGLSRSIRRLQVSVRDAAGKLAPSEATIEVRDDGDLGRLGSQMSLLTGHIERVMEELRQRDREIMRAEQLAAVGQLAAGVAHEIRNPLASIKMLVQAAREQSPGTLPVEDVVIIEREVRRLERSLQTFLDFARPPRPCKTAIDLREVVRRTLDLVRGRAARQKVELVYHDPPESIMAMADAGQLQQVMVNLALNSLDAMPAGGRLIISISLGDRSIEIHVDDCGPGFAPEMIGRLFQPFVSTKSTGLGLGLVISRRIAEDHGGQIVVNGRAEKGARVTLQLPADLPAS